jgi:hypothetical protein
MCFPVGERPLAFDVDGREDRGQLPRLVFKRRDLAVPRQLTALMNRNHRRDSFVSLSTTFIR